MKSNSLKYLPHFFSYLFLKRLISLIFDFLVENVVAVKKVKGDTRRISISSRFLYPENVYIGENSNINRNSYIWASPNAKIIIGKNCLTGPNLVILTSKFDISKQGYLKKSIPKEKSVIIGENVWIGANVVILPGVKIGNSSIVAAGTVLSRDLPDHSIAKGQTDLVIERRKYK